MRIKNMKNSMIFIRLNAKGTYHFVINNGEGANIFLSDRIRDWDTAKVQADFYVEQFGLIAKGYDVETPKEFNVA